MIRSVKKIHSNPSYSGQNKMRFPAFYRYDVALKHRHQACSEHQQSRYNVQQAVNQQFDLGEFGSYADETPDERGP